MPASLTALIGTALHQAQSAIADPMELDESLRLVTRATADTPVLCEIITHDLRVNGTVIPQSSPGAVVLTDALRQHLTARLQLPAGLTRAQWADVIALYASAPGLYTTVDQIRDAMRASVPTAIVTGDHAATNGMDLREAVFEMAGLRTAATTGDVVPPATSDAERRRSAQATALDPLLDAATEARLRDDFAEFARLLLEIHRLEFAADPGGRAFIARERRRVAPPDALDTMVRFLPIRASPPVLLHAATTIGRDGAEALVRALDGAPGPHERRVYIEALVRAREGDAVALEALRSDRIQLVCDAGEVIGRRQMQQAVPALAKLLRHRNEEIRTAAWRALEQIGSREAAEALRRSR